MQQSQPASGLLKRCAQKLRDEKEIAANYAKLNEKNDMRNIGNNLKTSKK
jgi:hypothetical protein